jgi:hypothetical protein
MFARFKPNLSYSGLPIKLTYGRYKHGRFVPKNVPPFHGAGYGLLPFDDQAGNVAIKYARWLAARDGIEIPRTEGRNRSGVGSTRRGASGDIVAGMARWFTTRFIVAVSRPSSGATKRKSVIPGSTADFYDQWVPDLRIDIPNWDFEHPPIELGFRTPADRSLRNPGSRSVK